MLVDHYAGTKISTAISLMNISDADGGDYVI